MSDISDLTFWIPTIIAFAGVALFYIDMRHRIKQERDASASLLNLITVMREELTLLRNQTQRGNLTQDELRRQAFLQKQQEFEWKKTVDILKGLGTLAKIAKQFDEE